MALGPDAIVGSWRIERRLGLGGMGAVWLARHTRLGSPAALKLLHSSDAEVDGRLRQEGRLQATLAHPNVVRVTDVLEVEGRAVLVLEYVDGPTLATLLAGGLRLTVREIDALGTGLLRGVDAAHQRGWVHRDLKPANVLLARSGPDLLPKVADFGIARAVAPDEAPFSAGTTTRGGIGTKRYMALEQLLGHPPEPRMDVFAIGAILFELCEGRPAFPTVEAWEAALRKGAYPVPTRADLPERMRAAITSSLCDRRTRLPTAGAVLARWSGRERSVAARWSAGIGAAVAVAAVVGGVAWLRVPPAVEPLPDLHDRGRWTFIDEAGSFVGPLLLTEGRRVADGRVSVVNPYVDGGPFDGAQPYDLDHHALRRTRADGTREEVDLQYLGIEDADSVTGWECGSHVFYRAEQPEAGWQSHWLLYDTRFALADLRGWQWFDPQRLGPRVRSYAGFACDDQHGWLGPYFDGSVHHGLAVQFDLEAPFGDPASYTVVDLEAMNPAAKGFIDVLRAEDGVYYGPWDGEWGRVIARYDRRRPFDAAESWDFVDLTPWDPRAVGLHVLGFDGRYLWFAGVSSKSRGNPDDERGVLVRFDTIRDGP
jgi:serine/threonine protein kinase